MKSDILNNQYIKINFKYRVKKGLTSVIIPVYKDVLGLKDTLESLQKQTISKKNYEVIVANDGADINISKLCKLYKINQVKITPNKGSYNARNEALKISRGEFLAFTDADIIVATNWLEEGIKSLKQNDYVGGEVKFINHKKLSMPEKYENLFEFNIESAFKDEFFCPTANIFTKRKLIHSLGGFDIRLKSSGDREFGNRIYLSNKFKQKYQNKITVLHPHRNYTQVLKKIIRIAGGWNDLIKYYPDRFEKFRYILVDDIIYAIKPPIKYFSDLSLFLFLWHLKFICLYINLKYRHENMRIIHQKSIIRRYFKT